MNSELDDLYAAVGAAIMHGHLVYADGDVEISEVENSGMFEKLGTIILNHEVHNVYRYVGKKSSTPISDEWDRFIREQQKKSEPQTTPSKNNYPWEQPYVIPYVSPSPYPVSDKIWASTESPLKASWKRHIDLNPTTFRGNSL